MNVLLCGECQAKHKIPMNDSHVEVHICNMCNKKAICAQYQIDETIADPLSEVGKHDWNKIDGWISPKGWVKPRKIAKIVTEYGDWAHFNMSSLQLIKEGFEPYDKVQVTYTPINERLGTGSLEKFTQQFVKYEDEIDLISILRDCVSETWGAKSFTEAQELFDKFLETRNLKP